MQRFRNKFGMTNIKTPMCGIFGYIGKETKAADLVLDGLKILEYRGYDSWGIAVRSEKGEMRIEKYVGKIGNAKLTSHLSSLTSPIGIGHTRWATHGGVTENNAHPHLDCTGQIAVVHNGIVENYEEIKKDLLKKGHKFISDTDTEVIPHLIEEMLNKQNLQNAVTSAFNKLKGMNAIVIADSASNKIIAAKNGSPLVIGKGKDAFYISSDASSLLAKTKDLLFLDDNQMAVLGKDLEILSLTDGKKQNAEFKKITWKENVVDKGTFAHFMLKEIYEQPHVLKNIAKSYKTQIESLAKTITEAKGTFFIGAGTASYAGIIGTYFFSKIADKHVNMSFASEFNYLLDFINPKSLVIALSQSGETIDVVEPLSIARKKGAKIVSLTNSEGSTIYRMSDKSILLGAGIEQAVASTKAYIAKLAILLLTAFGIKNEITKASSQILKAAEEIERILKEKDKLSEIVDLLAKSEHIYLIGRGVSYPTALEAALKIREVSYIHAEGLAGGELKHGTLALISQGTPCIVFAPNDETHDAVISNAAEIRSRGGVIIGVSPKNQSVFDHWIEVRDCMDASAIAQIVPIQLIAYYLALKKGYDPDKPRNLAKSVTVK